MYEEPEVCEIDVEEAKRLFDEKTAVFVDVRMGRDYASAHVPGAVHLRDDNVEDFVKKTPKDARIVVYCYHGYVSVGGADFLRSRGFTDVCSITGGFEAWRPQFPTERSA
ncbi:MAG: thiosulfate sulfurtransferase [Deltaproteobacteria bacterium]|nr:thiosulfate sulfurtransferase [Deltaproteobacteria bacterium]